MKASTFSEAQIAFVLTQAEEGTAAAEICEKAEISEAMFYNSQKRYADLMPAKVGSCTNSEGERRVEAGSC